MRENSNTLLARLIALVAVALCLIGTQNLLAQDIIPFGSAWEWLHPTDAVDPADDDDDFDETWFTSEGYDGPDFNGPDPGILGYGTIDFGAITTDIGTPPDGDRFTAYFRSKFMLTAPASGLVAELLADDGGVLYIDGEEVARINFSADDFFLEPTDAVGSETGTSTVNIDKELAAGEHEIAFSLHNQATTSSDIGFDLRLGPPPPPSEDVLPFGSDWEWLHPTEVNDPEEEDPDFNTTWFKSAEYDGPDFNGPDPGLFGYGTINWGAIETDIEEPFDGERYSAYFRTKLELAEDQPELVAEIFADDGGVLYIDGEEVTRINFSGDDTFFELTDAVGSEDDTTTITLDGGLTAGDHEIAFSLHNQATTSSDIGFDLRIGLPPATPQGSLAINGNAVSVTAFAQIGEAGTRKDVNWTVQFLGEIASESGFGQPEAEVLDIQLTDDVTSMRLFVNNVLIETIPFRADWPQVVTSATGIVLTGEDVDASVIDPDSVMLTVDDEEVAAVVEKVGTTTTVTYTPSPAWPFGTTHTYSITALDDGGHAITAGGSFSLPAPLFPAGDLPGAEPVSGMWATRYIWDAGTINVTEPTLAVIQAAAEPGFDGQVFDTTSEVINHGDEGSDPPEDGIGDGLFGAGAGDGPGDLPYPDEVIDGGGGTDDFIQYNIGYIRIPAAGDYTFGLHTDDGFGLRIRGLEFTEFNAGANRTIDPASSDTFIYTIDTGDSDARVCARDAQPGVYRVEFFWWERGGGDYGEIYVAPGCHLADADTDEWELISATSVVPLVDVPGGTGFQITELNLIEDAGGNVTEVTIQWTSRDGETYTVERSSDLASGGGFWEEVTDGVDATGDSTEFNDRFLPDPVPSVLYYRVKKE